MNQIYISAVVYMVLLIWQGLWRFRVMFIFIKAGRRAGVDNLYKYIDQVGLVEKTGIDLPGEVAGDASNPEKKKAANLPWLDEWYEDEKNKLEENMAIC